MKHAHGTARNILTTMLSLSLAAPLANAIEPSFKAPPNARTPATSAHLNSLPKQGALSGPMSNASIGALMMRAEADPPEVTRGGGGPGLEKLFAARCRSVVLIINTKKQGNEHKPTGSGTGSVITIDGHILTAAHVVEDGDGVVVGVFPTCKPGAQPEFLPGKTVKVDSARDLAIVQLTKMPSDISVMPLGSLDEVRTGSDVVIIGHPQGLLMSLSQGSVSAIRPGFQWNKSRRATVIQTDGALNPGNSGGPMMFAEGNLVGVNSFIHGQASAGLNFAVSVTDVREFIAAKQTTSPAPTEQTAKAKTASPNEDCKLKAIEEWSDADGDYVSFDSQCTGKADAWLFKPKAKGLVPRQISFSA